MTPASATGASTAPEPEKAARSAMLLPQKNGIDANTSVTVGTRLHELRQERGLSQRGLAELAGVSPNAISLIERNEISPSVATLQHLAGALKVTMGFFFDTAPTTNVVYAKAGSGPTIASGGVAIEGLGSRLNDQVLESYRLTVAPHADAGAANVVHTGQELVYCLSGQIEYRVADTVYLLQPHDFLLFEASLPHYWRNPTEEKAAFLLILQAPRAANDPARWHFARYPSVAHLG